MDMKLAVDVIPVSDLEEAKEFYQRLDCLAAGMGAEEITAQYPTVTAAGGRAAAAAAQSAHST